MRLKGMLAEMAQSTSSPIAVQAALREMQAGVVFDEYEDFTHRIFDWIVDYSKTEASEQDQETLAKSPEGLSGDEAKQLKRQQKKARKRSAKAGKTKQSKVTDELVAAVQELLEGDTPAHAAGFLLEYVSAIILHIRPQDAAEIIRRCAPLTIGYAISMKDQSQELGRLAPAFGSKVEWWVEFYYRSCAGMQQTEALELQEIAELQKPVKPKRKATLTTFDNKPLCELINFKPELTPEWLELIRDPRHTLKVSVLDIPFTLRPAKSWHFDINFVVEALRMINDFNGPQERRDNIGSANVNSLGEIIIFMASYREISFKTPPEAMFFNAVMGDCIVNTVVNEDELKLNVEEMANCTASHKGQLAAGTEVLWQIIYEGEMYNANTYRNGNGNWKPEQCYSKSFGSGVSDQRPAPDPVQKVHKQIVDVLNTTATTLTIGE